MKIVKFKDGQYGIRKGWFPLRYRYKDLKNIGYWWRINEYTKDCRGSLEQVKECFTFLNDYGDVIK